MALLLALARARLYGLRVMVDFIIEYTAWFYWGLLLFSISLAVFLWQRERRTALRLKVFKAGLESSRLGVLLFDKKKCAVHMNKRARVFMPGLYKEEAPLRFPVFMRYLYDHAIEPGRVLNGAVHRMMEGVCGESFREILSWEQGKYCLVDIEKATQDHIAVYLFDITCFVKQEEARDMRPRQKPGNDDAMEARSIDAAIAGLS